MIHFYTNRQLAATLNINLSRWKRWTREFLPPDPLGGLQSGLARQYTIAEAFTVYLCGYLVSSLNFSIPEARKIADDLHPFLEAIGLLEGYGRRPQPTASSPEDIEATHIRIWRLPASRSEPVRFGYLLRQRLHATESRGGLPGIVVERIRETPFGEAKSRPSPGEPRGWRTLNIGLLHLWFMDRIGNSVA
jgi:hypothetical protein